jgi:hypothetical protein
MPAPVTINRKLFIFKPLKQHDSEIYCSFTGIKNQVDEITPGNNIEKK